MDSLALVALHHAGPSPPWQDLPGWLTSAPIEDLFAVAVRSIGLALAYWVALSILLAAGAFIARKPTLMRAARFVAAPFIRPLIGRMLVASVAVVPAPAIAAWASPPAAHQPIEILPPYVPVPAGTDNETVALPELSGPGTAAVDQAKYVVEPGDNLWRIACRQVAAETGTMKPTSREIIPYWLELISLNRDRIRSGDPDLIYPGEELLLP